MKRDHFLKAVAVFASGLTVVSCKPDLLEELVVNKEALDNLSIEEAKKWFNESYLPNATTLRIAGDDKKLRRQAAWQRSKKPLDAQNKELPWVWVPIDYEDESRPGVILYDEETKYRLELSKYFVQPIIEGLIVIKKGEDTQAFLAQIAYDPIALMANNYKLEKATFTGTLLKASWNDELIDGFSYEKGKLIKAFANPTSTALRNARTADCTYYELVYTTFKVVNGEPTITAHTQWASVCSAESGGGGWGGGGGTTVTQGGTGGGAYYDPLLNSGGGNWVIPYTYNFNFNTAKTNPNSTDRAHINNNLKNAVYSVGLGYSIAGWSIDKAVALARSVGGTINHFSPLFMRLGTTLGGIGVIASGYQLMIGLKNGLTWEEDAWNALAFALGVTAIVFTGTWIAVGTGAVSIIIGIATAP